MINKYIVLFLAVGLLSCKSSKKNAATNVVDEVKPAEAAQVVAKPANPQLSDASDVFKNEVAHEAVEEVKA